ncbi:MAG: hypothetical protein VKJ46_08090 [Leptolyngbyaceae bacterium]|nr:hypothetical protein [Leptolyngbyaceae bacterium]
MASFTRVEIALVMSFFTGSKLMNQAYGTGLNPCFSFYFGTPSHNALMSCQRSPSSHLTGDRFDPLSSKDSLATAIEEGRYLRSLLLK